jgi:hypothetical protein
MPRFLLALALLTIASPLLAQNESVRAEYGTGNHDYINYPEHGPASPAWTAAPNPGPHFPVLVRLNPESLGYDGVSYFGTANVHIFDSAHAGEDLDFHYNCGIGFQPGEYFARWDKTAHKLEIRIRKPGTNETRSCHMKVLAANHP